MEKEVMEEEEEARAGRLLRHPLSCLAGTGSNSLISRKEPDGVSCCSSVGAEISETIKLYLFYQENSVQP